MRLHRLTQPSIATLEDSTLDLGNLLQVDVPNHHRPSKRQDHNSTARGEQDDFSVGISILDGRPRSSANGIAFLLVDIGVDGIDIRHGRLRQTRRQCLVEGIRPDRGTDGVTRRATNSSHNVQQTKSSGDVLVVDSRQNSQLLDDDENRTTHRDEDLTHHLVPVAHVWLAEVDHQALGEDVQGHRDIQQPLVAPGLADDESDTDQQQTGYHVEGVGDVACFGEGQVVVHLQPGLEVVVPAVVGQLVCGIQETGAEDSPVGQEAVVEQGGRGDESLVDAKEEYHRESNHDHGDDVPGGPAVRGLGGDIEGKLEHDETGSEDENTGHCTDISLAFLGSLREAKCNTHNRIPWSRSKCSATGCDRCSL